MTSRLGRITPLALAVVCHAGIAGAQRKAASWLDAVKPASFNEAGRPVPTAPHDDGAVDARCRDAARPPQLDEDKRLRDRGWDLVGPFQGGWQTLVIRATAGYDGMCRPRRYQDFVFVRGVFAGTLSPAPMESRTDGAISRVFLQSANRLTAEYQRYEAADPLCCPSRTTSVVFEISAAPPIVRPVSASGH
jgi:hypothetical protein